ncbi:hypothetical protein QP547_03825 [Weeksella virosa]|uniref:hypothetical protein n=1 Tax=Weeksella virosa TaxID=1014 RepID=UPI002553F454|nr:hypothetical protein [Weeksella virosa]MDK7674937.1 hypothetical protein [Weeksella virosa]
MINKNLFLILILLISTISYAKNEIWLIGTFHEENHYMTPDSLTIIFNKIKPDLILIELEEKHFTKDFNFNTEKYPIEDFLTTNENIASYHYQQLNGTLIRSFDVNGRNEFYRKEKYHEKENKMFSEMLNIYKEDKFSESCRIDFEILLQTLKTYSELKFNSLQESNSDLATKFLSLKNKINFELMISIIKRTDELKEWLEFAELRKEFWDRRNKIMAENIAKYSNEFKGKQIIVLVGNDHKYALLDLLEEKNIKVKNYYKE